MAFGFAPPLQHRLPSGAQSAQAAMSQSLAANSAAGATPAAPATPSLPPLQPVKPAGPATMMPSTDLPPLVAPSVPNAPGIADASGAVGDAVNNVAGGFNAAGGGGMDIGDLVAALFG